MAASGLMVSLLLAAAAAACGAAGASTANTALDEVCGALGGYYVTPAACASALCRDDPSPPCRAARDAAAVAALAARLAAANATAARDSVAAASAAAADPAAKAGLQSCLQLYAGIVPALGWAAGSVAAGRYPGAREVLQAAQYVPAACDGVVAAGAAVPAENGGFGAMATVAHAVLASLSKGY